MVHSSQIVILGAGPAGSVTALRLAKLGYEVTVVGRHRLNPTWEGLSARAVEGLRTAGCSSALATLESEVQRIATWNGETAAANRERIVDRSRFDAALEEDLIRAGVRVYAGRVGRCQADADGWAITLQRRAASPLRVHAGFLIEARGREAPIRGGKRLGGPATTALTASWEMPAVVPPMTAVAGFEDGWGWLAVGPKGRGSLQLLVSSETGELPGRSGLAEFYRTKVSEAGEIGRWIEGASLRGPVTARAAATSMVAPLTRHRMLRVGDAALAIDPLSGHGIFEAVGSALAAAPVVNTILRNPERSKLALDYYRQRVEQTFHRYGRIGRDFYRQEQRWSARPFWRVRQRWPDDFPAHPSLSAEPPRIVERPVISDDTIVCREVIVTADHPRGVWQVAGVPIVALLRSGINNPEIAAAEFERPLDDASTAIQWLRYRGLVAARSV